MNANDNTTIFGGLDRNDNRSGRVPDWYRAMTDTRGVDAPNLRDALLGLELATKVPLAYVDEVDLPSDVSEFVAAVTQAAQSASTVDDVLEAVGIIESEKYRALVNPRWLGKQNRDAADKGDALWQPPTHQYVPVNPIDAYGPLLAVTRAKGHGDAQVFGEIREWNFGGEVHMDIFFDDIRTRIPNGPEFIWGVTTGYDFRGYVSHYAHLIAVDPERKVVYRRLYPNAGKRRHIGSLAGDESATDDIASWWSDIFDHLEAATNALLSTVAAARAHTIDMAPYTDPSVLFEGNGLAKYSAEAAGRLHVEMPANTVTAFDAFTAASATIFESFDGKDDGNAAKDYTNAANRFLFSPSSAEAKALGRQKDLYDDRDSLTVDEQADRADVVERIDSLGTATTTARTFRKRLRDILEAAKEAAEDDEADDDGEQTDLESAVAA